MAERRGQIELLARREGERTLLVAPEVGVFTGALERGALLGPGQSAGVILCAGREVELVVPSGAAGRVASERPERVHEPVSYGAILYELLPVEGDAGAAAAEEATAGEEGLVFRAPQAGRFYHRPSPEEAAYVEPGAKIAAGQVVGLLEVMKTFSQVAYEAQGGLPASAKLVRWLCDDGGEVRAGDSLFEVEAG